MRTVHIEQIRTVHIIIEQIRTVHIEQIRTVHIIIEQIGTVHIIIEQIS